MKGFLHLWGEKVARKRRKRLRLTKQLQNELLGLLLIFLSIFGSGASMISDGFIPTSLENVFKLFLGVWYFTASIILFIIGLYLIIKRQFPRLFTKRTIGFIILFLSVLLFTHIQTFEKLFIDVENTSIIKSTWTQFTTYMNGHGGMFQLGGGLIGAFLFALNNFLFSVAGTKIVSVFSFFIGLMFMTNLSLGNVYQKGKELAKKTTQFVQSLYHRIIEKKEKDTTNEEEQKEEPTSTENEQEEQVAVQYAYDEKADPTNTDSKEQNEIEGELDIVLHSSNKRADGHDDYKLPSIQLLNEPVVVSQEKERAQIKRTVQILEDTFKSFGVEAKITKAHVGPAVTRYEVHPEAGVKVSRIVNLHDDIALALAAEDIRIEAPIPGKSALGIEVPNKDIATVPLREILQLNNQRHKKLLFALGRAISGEIIEGELNKMPHLLIAGATGSGKSVCINSIIISILMRAKPHEVKMLMIDPKKVELNVYNGIPHLLAPVVTDPKKAAMALHKVVREMEYRYELFSETGTRNIESYNEYVMTHEAELTDRAPLPYIVVIVDELADLMMVASNEVEDAITRLAQMARAAGIHLIIATQRPSVDVITGVIKANIPSRIAFSVSSQVDSRTILDTAGAEKLLGRGDMLYIPVGRSKPIRVQGAFLTDQEVERVVEHCRNEQAPEYEEEMIIEHVDEDTQEVDDELYDDAVQLVIEMQSASVSMLQRRFRIGYNRAARLIDAMEERGIVGPYEGNKPRTVLVDREEEEESS